MHRFYVPPATIRNGGVQLTGPAYEQIRRVLRMRPGDEVALFDGGGQEYRVSLVEFANGTVYGRVLEQYPVATEPDCQVDLYLALLNKADKFEWALQKCTELGAARFVPLIAARSVTSAGRTERWERIIQEAAEQSGRGWLPELSEAIPFEQAVSTASASGLTLMPEVTGEQSLGETIASRQGSLERVAIFIGPEGGFTQEEQQFAKEQGVEVVKMGPRVLRAETAAVAAVTILLDRLGELGP